MSAVIAGISAAVVASYQARMSIANAARLAIEAFDREQRAEREKSKDEAVMAVGALVHDAHAPLNIIASFVDLATEEDVDAHERSSLLDRMEAASNRLADHLSACHRVVWTHQYFIGPQANQAFYQMLSYYGHLRAELQILRTQAEATRQGDELVSTAATVTSLVSQMLDCTYRMLNRFDSDPVNPMTGDDREVSNNFIRITAADRKEG
ncbi:hypothetical protein [Actinoplanes sp. CA-252034]|uniref:hypothetical protein n=1 Tax=Actinoplanes sp. CA-252034 TaxID=3239906 RepID=UPI003D95C4DC